MSLEYGSPLALIGRRSVMMNWGWGYICWWRDFCEVNLTLFLWLLKQQSFWKITRRTLQLSVRSPEKRTGWQASSLFTETAVYNSLKAALETCFRKVKFCRSYCVILKNSINAWIFPLVRKCLADLLKSVYGLLFSVHICICKTLFII